MTRHPLRPRGWVGYFADAAPRPVQGELMRDEKGNDYVWDGLEWIQIYGTTPDGRHIVYGLATAVGRPDGRAPVGGVGGAERVESA